MPRRKAETVVVSGYTVEELYDLWSRFGDDYDPAKVLSELMGNDGNTQQAEELIKAFEIRREVAVLNGDMRGKEERIKKTL